MIIIIIVIFVLIIIVIVIINIIGCYYSIAPRIPPSRIEEKLQGKRDKLYIIYISYKL